MVEHVAEVLVFHHACGLTAGVLAFAEEIRSVGHVVHTPDLYEGSTFTSVVDGVHFAEQVGFDTIIERGRISAEELPRELVYAGFSLGVLPAQMLAQTRSGAAGALLFHGCIPPAELGGGWPAHLPLQIHMMERDEFVVNDGDLDAGRQLAETVGVAELFLYAGDRHLFADSSLADYDQDAATLLKERVRRFLDDIDDGSTA